MASAVTTEPAPAPHGTPRVSRSERHTRPVAGLGVVVLGVLVAAPFLFSQANTTTLVNFFILLTMATMWNLLAGYAGMVSIGQQAFIGLGAYSIVVLASHGLNPLASIPLAAIICAVIALPVSLLVFRLRGGYFAVATWVVANTAQLVISTISSVGGGTGASVHGLSGYSPKSFGEVIYWAALAVAVVAIATTYAVLRSRLGLVLGAVRDDEVGAQSAGANVLRARRIVFLVAALGCGAAGALLAVSQLQVQPTAVFSVQWSAEMIFVTVIGGLGTLEGPIIGTIIFFALQQNLASQGVWYLIIFGSLAVIVAIWTPRGLWGSLTSRYRAQLFPLGHRVVMPEASGASSE
jgi:branched-chain amino acid transport system permease protein